ncbi:MAG: hypothetical protein LN408_04970 [Candidatus Thermoplasmatota archaeon]|jgi:hypothetical protein|nr:hypothetical protein [Candidatus Thermoplasmatota archaeon]MCK5301063.1 hypothetical protein [Thermoplasmatales archaeon]
MIGLEFVKTVDKEWKNSIKFADGSPYYNDYCPLSGARCKKDDCSFWDLSSDICGYLK